MSALIHHFVVHQLAVNQQQELTLVPRASCFDVSPEIENLAQQINHAFNTKPGKGVGAFVAEQAEIVSVSQEPLANEEPSAKQEPSDADEPQTLTPHATSFKTLLEDMQSEKSDFVEFSIQASQLLKKSLIDTGTLETGFVVFSHYQFLATDYLMIAIINTKQHVEIDRDLELTSSDHLDLAKMQLAVRIDLTQLAVTAEQMRYISFIKGRMGRKVSDFFMHFIGCEELVDVKQQNKQLLTTVDAFLSAEQLDPQEKHQARETVSNYYKEKLELGEDIQIQELAAKLPSDHVSFEEFNQSAELPVEEQFQADRGVLKTLAKFSGQGGGVSLSFERKLLGDRVSYDAGSDTLMIRGIPPNLKDQLLKSQS
ncbi:nucleoid-associated protein [Paraglaciecola sp. MB-3u-78]|uniref:nucleoid-associated protein n=1 Tax=Paraglaciecola sp. MB-3u-78 TaxID=2058332 RepID=UPI000C3221B6|nr:nucleoid-associated protein [Paraglaciecola sp. MB-3u-78]PKH00273.1 nucleoid-associated protein YejK [Paraglaciecola sp. MB-3u-78]